MLQITKSSLTVKLSYNGRLHKLPKDDWEFYMLPGVEVESNSGQKGKVKGFTHTDITIPEIWNE